MTLKDFFKTYTKIVIPHIQRHYAQGRRDKHSTMVREKLVQSILIISKRKRTKRTLISISSMAVPSEGRPTPQKKGNLNYLMVNNALPHFSFFTGILPSVKRNQSTKRNQSSLTCPSLNIELGRLPLNFAIKLPPKILI